MGRTDRLTMSRTGRGKISKIALVGSTVVLLGGIASAQEDAEEDAGADEQEVSENVNSGVNNVPFFEFQYPDEEQPQLGPTDAEEILNGTMPTEDAIFGDVVLKDYARWKLSLYEKYGLKLGTHFQALFQSASAIAPFGEFDTAAGDWVGAISQFAGHCLRRVGQKGRRDSRGQVGNRIDADKQRCVEGSLSG